MVINDLNEIAVICLVDFLAYIEFNINKLLFSYDGRNVHGIDILISNWIMLKS